MIDRCEPPEELRGVDGWHWLGHKIYPTEIGAWDAESQLWDEGEDSWTPGEYHQRGYRYIAPVTPLAEVAALRAEIERLREALLEARKQTLSLCEATENDSALADTAAHDTEGKMGAFARGRRFEAKSIRRTMAEVFREIIGSNMVRTALGGPT